MFLAKEKGVDLNKPLTEADMKKLGSVWASLTPQYNQTSRTASDSLKVYQENLQKIQNQTNNITNVGTEVSTIDPSTKVTDSTSDESIKQIAQIPATEEGESKVNIMNLPIGDLSQNDPSNIPAPSIAANNVPFLMPYDETNLYRLGTIGNYNIISTS